MNRRLYQVMATKDNSQNNKGTAKMKQKDIANNCCSGNSCCRLLSISLSTFLFGGEKAYKLKAPTVEAISAEFKLPDSTYFNKQLTKPNQKYNHWWHPVILHLIVKTQ